MGSENGTSFIAGDIGGTNARFALVAKTEEGFTIVDKVVYETTALENISQGIAPALSRFRSRSPNLRPRGCAISAAGPVEDNRCRLSNVRWSVDGEEVSRSIDLPTVVINDFTAICYGLALLDTTDRRQLVPLPRPDGETPAPHGKLAAVVGAGTGLGVGFLVHETDGPKAFPSEGGHMDFASFDAETEELKRFVAEGFEQTPGTEQFVSGQGIANIFRFLHRRTRGNGNDTVNAIAEADDDEIPSLVSHHAEHDSTCAHAMRLFVRMYGRYAGNIALGLLPRAGLYLAGGIVAKNLPWFLEEPTFAGAFEQNYKASVRPVLRSIPLYAITEPAVSLYGAAYAGWLQALASAGRGTSEHQDHTHHSDNTHHSATESTGGDNA